jgi:hypothetical protein
MIPKTWALFSETILRKKITRGVYHKFFPPQPIRAQLCCCFDSQTQFAALHRPPGKAYRLYPVGDR